MSASCIPFTSATGRGRKASRPGACKSKISAERGAKSRPLRVPPGKIVQAQALLVQGHSQRSIGRELRISPMTVAKIIKSEDFQSFIKEMQERLFAIAPIALEAFRAEVATNGILAHAFLKDLGIIPSGETMARFLNAATPTESEYERQARLIAHVMLSAHEELGVELPEDVTAALAKDSESQEAKTSQPKLLRK